VLVVAAAVTNMLCEAHNLKVLSTSHNAFKLDSGLRRNDDEAKLRIAQSLPPHRSRVRTEAGDESPVKQS